MRYFILYFLFSGINILTVGQTTKINELGITQTSVWNNRRCGQK